EVFRCILDAPEHHKIDVDDVLVEAQDDAEFVWVDAEGEGEEGGDGYDHHDGEEEERAGEAAAARHGLPKLIPTAPEQVFEFARRAAAPRSPPLLHGMVSSFRWLLQDTFQLLRVDYQAEVVRFLLKSTGRTRRL